MGKKVLKSKFLGALVGTGVGDAVGAGFEGWHAAEAEMVKAVADEREVLMYTDDTHMMIGMAESLVAREGFDGEHMALTFMRNYEREPWRGYGPGPPHIFRMIRAGEAWNKAAEKVYPGGSFGNGSAMRIAPVGVFYHDDLAMLKDVAYKSSQITHSHELGKEGAALQACAVALAVSLEPAAAFDPEEFLAKLGRFVQHEVYKQKLENIGELLGKTDRARVVAELGNGIEAFNSVPTAIYSFLSHPHSFEESILFAVSLGGDTDTIAAMTGAISGAYLGVDAVPDEWRNKLENRLYIEELAEKLYQVWIGKPPHLSSPSRGEE
jgi:poly(ADP-ribose) glycohydrolase ARH3